MFGNRKDLRLAIRSGAMASQKQVAFVLFHLGAMGNDYRDQVSTAFQERARPIYKVTTK